MSMLSQEMSVISLRLYGYLETTACLSSLKQQLGIWVCPVVPKKSTDTSLSTILIKHSDDIP